MKRVVWVPLAVALASALASCAREKPRTPAPDLSVTNVEPITFSETYLPEHKRVMPVVTEAHKTAFAQVETVSLVLHERYDLIGGTANVDAGVRAAVARVMEEVGLQIAAGPDTGTDAELMVDVWARPYRWFGMGAPSGQIGSQVRADLALSMGDLQPVRADWRTGSTPTRGAESHWQPCSRDDLNHDDWSGARQAALTAALRILAATMPGRIAPLSSCGDPEVASSAVYALGELGEGQVAAVLSALRHDDPLPRAAAVRVLGALGPAAVPGLSEALGDNRAVVREDAAKALRRMGPQAADAVPALTDALKREPPSKRRHHVDDPRIHVCRDDPDCQSLRVKEALIRALTEIGPEAHPAAPQLARLLGDYDLGHWAKGALAKIGGHAVPFLIEALGAETTREHALSALSEIGPDASEAVPALIDVLRHSPNQWTRCEAAGTVRRAAPPGDAAAIAALVAALDDPRASVRIAAARGLADIARRDKQAIEALTAARDAEPDPDAAEIMSRELDAMADDAVERLTSQMLNDRDPRRRDEAAGQLRRLASDDESVVPALIEALNDDSDSVRRVSAEMLGHFGAESEAAREALLRALKREASSIAFFAVAEAVAEVGREGGAVVEPLAEMAGATDPRQRRLAARALAYMGPQAEPALPALVETIESCEMDVRREVAFALGEIGDRRAIPALRRALKDQEPDVRRSAGDALSKISGREPPEGPPGGW